MSILRILKLKEINEELNNLKGKEKLFIEMFDNIIEIVDKHGVSLNCKRNKAITLLFYDKKRRTVLVSAFYIYQPYYRDYNMNYNQVVLYVRKMIRKHFNIKDFILQSY